MAEAYILDAVRTPRGKGKPDGSLHSIKPVTLLSTVLNAVAARNQLDTGTVDDVVMGCVTPLGEQGADIARTGVLSAEWDQRVAGVTLNRFCGSGLESVNLAAAKVRSGFEDLVVGGGVESMSRVPMGKDGGAWAMDPETALGSAFVPQGISADLIATLEGFTREDVDTYAVRSQERATKAREKGYFDRSVVPVVDQNGVTVLDHDEFIRPETTMATLGSLRPSFAKLGATGFDQVAVQRYPSLESITHVHTPGNSSGIVDGAAAVLVGSQAAADRAGLEPRARIVSAAVIGSEPTIMLTGPTPAAHKALAKAGMTAADLDLVEINEAFAAVVLKFVRDLDLDPERVNVNGGAIAMGHPLGATGAMILGTLVDELERRDLQTGLATLCIGGGMGIATIVERV